MTADPNEARSSLHRLRFMTWWSTSGLAYAGGAVAAFWLLVASGSAVARGVVLVAVVATSAGSARLFAHPLQPIADEGGERYPDAEREAPSLPLWALGVGGAGTLTVALLGPQLGQEGMWAPAAPAVFFAATAVAAPRRFRLRIAGGGVVATVVLAAAGEWLATGGVSRPLVQTALFMGALFGFTFVSQAWIWDAARRLDGARRLAAELAVADERLRFAADLHDIQGHHLQVIALKSELAGRLAQAEPAAATAQMAEVQQLARAALEGTRELVQGYRRVSLADELANATRVLAAAGIDCEPPPDGLTEELTEPARHLLGLVVREATTNVLRHSRARRAALRLTVEDTTAVLELHNDGTAAGRNGDSGRGGDGDGTGLSSLATRLAASGGSLAWGHDGGWFRVVARLPVDSAGTR